MKKFDFRSVLIGILGSALIFTLYGLRFQDENLGNITVKSITIESGGNIIPFSVLNKNGDPVVGIMIKENNPTFILFNSKRAPLAIISTPDGDYGMISTFSSDEKTLVTLSMNEGRYGIVSTYTDDGKPSVNLSTAAGGDGSITTYSPN